LFVLAGSNHALEEKDPRGVAEAMLRSWPATRCLFTPDIDN
jgi:hypothetical protein